MSLLLLGAFAALGQPQPANAPPGGDLTWRNVGPGRGLDSVPCVRSNARGRRPRGL